MKRQIIKDDRSEHCQDQKEDVAHALYLCPKLLELWTKVNLWNYSSLRQATSFIDLMGCVFAENREPTLFSMAIWAIWNRRNNLHLGKSAVPLSQLLSQSKERLREFNLHNSSTITPVMNFDGALFAAETMLVWV